MNAQAIDIGALQAMLRRTQLSSAGSDTVKATLCQATSLMDEADVSPSEVFHALSEGAPDTGMKYLCKTLSVSVRFLSTWGVLTVLLLGYYQGAQAVGTTGSWIWGQIKNLTGMASSMTPLGSVFSGVKKLFGYDAYDAAPTSGFQMLTAAIAAEVPVAGALLTAMNTSGIASYTPTSAAATSTPVQSFAPTVASAPAAAQSTSIVTDISSLLGGATSFLSTIGLDADMGMEQLSPLAYPDFDARDAR